MTDIPPSEPVEAATAPTAEFWHGLITEADAADFLGFTTPCLQGWRYRGGGPRFYCIGSRIRYTRIDLARYARERQRLSTSAAPE